MLFFYGELLALRPAYKREDYPLSAVHYWLFATPLRIWGPFPPSATWGRAVHLTGDLANITLSAELLVVRF